MITLEGALRAAQSAINTARARNAIIAVAVCDDLGRLKAFLKMDGATDVMMGHEAMRRAIHSASTGTPSDDTSTPLRTALVEAEGIGGSTRPGGLPYMKGDEVGGAVGVAGADDEICVACAAAGVHALAG